VVDAGVLKVDDGGFCDGLHGADGFEEVELGEGGIAVGVLCQYSDVSIGNSLAVQGEDGFAQEGFEVLWLPVADDLDFDALGFEDFGCIDMRHGLVVVGDLAGVAAVCDEFVAIGLEALYVFEPFLQVYWIVEVLVRVEEDAPVSFFQTALKKELEALAVCEPDEVLSFIDNQEVVWRKALPARGYGFDKGTGKCLLIIVIDIRVGIGCFFDKGLEVFVEIGHGYERTCLFVAAAFRCNFGSDIFVICQEKNPLPCKRRLSGQFESEECFAGACAPGDKHARVVRGCLKIVHLVGRQSDYFIFRVADQMGKVNRYAEICTDQ